ncbi:ABC transporter ATP-binding protein [Fodinicurvata sp. EGI_FJ10296]|uniref:ABC transporter ATP-binding protein n=1 Tax=Fodinicurvata sp. EGI_FJ10296 TaxID=3231908 RepID=UPI003454C783
MSGAGNGTGNGAGAADVILDVRDVRAAYDKTDVLTGVSLEVRRGEFVCVIGANTAGKTTLLKTISRLIPRSSGTITLDGADLMGRRAHEVPALGLAHVPEGRHVFPDMTVVENLKLGAYTVGDPGVVEGRLRRVFDLFPRLAERQRQHAGTLSGGEQQMVAVGRALMLEPKLLVLDEPSHGLAPIVVEELHNRLVEINRSGVSVLLVEQNVQMALSVAQRGYVLQSGQFVLSGSAEALMKDDKVREAYLGI